MRDDNPYKIFPYSLLAPNNSGALKFCGFRPVGCSGYLLVRAPCGQHVVDCNIYPIILYSTVVSILS